MSQTGIVNFNKTAPWVMALLMQDFDFSLDDAAAICGNGGHESDGLRAINEANPVVKGSRGGFGWFQWTASRRVAFEKYCSRNNLSPLSDKANYNWLWNELNGDEKKAVEAVKNADSLEEKVEAFERSYERAGVKHYPSRVEWAKRALMAWQIATDEDKTAPWLRGAAPAPETRFPVETPRPPAIPDFIRDMLREHGGKIAGELATDVAEKAIDKATGGHTEPAKPDPEVVGKSPVEKVIGAGKGAILGAGGSITFGAAVVYLMDIAGYIPAGTDSAMLGLAVGTIISTVTTGISAMVGTYLSKRNSNGY